MKSQRGGFFVGMIVGLLVGLALALAVALYVTKVPVPFVNKVPQRTAEQDAAEAEKNKNWDPNAPLAGKTPAKPATPAPGAASGPAPANGTVARPAPPFAPAAGVNANAPAQAKEPAPAAAAATPAAQAAASDAFVYFVQAGAFARTEEAEQQRAKLAMLGLEARITERDQAGKIIYRVRVGPYDKRADAEAVKEKLDTSGAGESALVRVQKP